MKKISTVIAGLLFIGLSAFAQTNASKFEVYQQGKNRMVLLDMVTVTSIDRILKDESIDQAERNVRLKSILFIIGAALPALPGETDSFCIASGRAYENYQNTNGTAAQIAEKCSSRLSSKSILDFVDLQAGDYANLDELRLKASHMVSVAILF